MNRILNGERSLAVEAIKRLSQRFELSVHLFNPVLVPSAAPIVQTASESFWGNATSFWVLQVCNEYDFQFIIYLYTPLTMV